MRAYSTDLRERVLAALARGMSRREVITTFAIRPATLTRWVARQRAGRALTPGQSTGRPHTIPAAALPALRARLTAAPDATLAAHLAWWRAQHPDQPVSRSALDRAITRLGWTRKKRPSAPVNKTP